jgi:anionic cell wall polymer biosynthesis LytR-Cps2A-Psr (LCP) family protein
MVVLLLLACVGVVVLQQQIASAVAMADVRPNHPFARPLIAPMNILLAGVDSRPDHPEEGIRSDSLLLLHLDPGGGWANLLSIPRDSLATIPGYGDAKINSAFSHGYATAAVRIPSHLPVHQHWRHRRSKSFWECKISEVASTTWRQSTSTASPR